MVQRSAREELIRIHKRLVSRIQREIRDSLGPEDPQIARYYKTYQQSFRHFEVTNKQALTDAIIAADVVYNGDYHTLRQSQKIPIRILTDVVKVRKQIVLCLEMVMEQYQAEVDRYMAGELDDEAFLAAIDYSNTWGFEWLHYKVLFDFARENDIRVVALNNAPEGKKNSLALRDARAAKIIARETLANPAALVYVIDGDLHVAREHLPAEVDKLLAAQDATRKSLLIFHNAERIYWRLARDGHDQVDVVRLADDAFCVMNTTPTAKYQSYLNWLDHREELVPCDAEGWALGDGGVSFTDQVAKLVRVVASFLELSEEGLEDFTVYTARDHDFLKILREDGAYTPHEIEEIRAQILRDESYFIPQGNIIYLSNLSINHAAEEASHFVHHKCAGTPTEPMTMRADFYYRALREALGFLGSKIINHKRTCYKEKDFEDYIEQTRRQRLDKKGREIRKICELVVQHKTMEREYFQTRKTGRLRSIYKLSTGLHLGVTHALGYMLGDKMYYAMIYEELTKQEVRDLFHDPFANGPRAFSTYMSLSKRMEAIHERCYAKDVCL